MTLGIVTTDPTKISTRDGSARALSLDATGALRVTSASGGSQPEPTSFTTTNTTGIGSASVLVSAAYPGGKRSIINDGTVLLRLVPAAGVTTGGLALPAGGAYVIDGQNPLAAAMYAYAPSGTGSVSEIRR